MFSVSYVDESLNLSENRLNKIKAQTLSIDDRYMEKSKHPDCADEIHHWSEIKPHLQIWIGELLNVDSAVLFDSDESTASFFVRNYQVEGFVEIEWKAKIQ